MTGPKYSSSKAAALKLALKKPAPHHLRPPTNRRERRHLARVLKCAATAQGREQ